MEHYILECTTTTAIIRPTWDSKPLPQNLQLNEMHQSENSGVSFVIGALRADHTASSFC